MANLGVRVFRVFAGVLLGLNFAGGVNGQSAGPPTVEVEFGPIAIQSDGAFSFGSDTGSISGGAQGRFVFTVGGVVQIPFDAEVGGGVLVGLQHSDDEPYDETAMLFLTRQPTALVTSELAGSWTLAELEMKPIANQAQLEVNAPAFTLVVASDGTFQLPDGTGMMSPDGSGRVQVVTGAETLLFDISAGKDFMVGAVKETDGTTYLRMLVKQPGGVTAGQVAGDWRFNQLGIEAAAGRDYSRIAATNVLVSLASDLSFSLDGVAAGNWAVTNSPPGVYLWETGDTETNILAVNASGTVAVEVTDQTGDARQTLAAVVRSPASMSVASLAGDWRLTRLAIRHLGNSARFWHTNHYQGGELWERFEARYVDGLLEKDGRLEEFDLQGRYLRQAFFTNDQILVRTNFGYHLVGGTNMIAEADFRTDGSQISEVIRTLDTNGVLARLDRRLFFGNGRHEEEVATVFQPDGTTNSHEEVSFRVDGTRISQLAVFFHSNGIPANWDSRDYLTNDTLGTVTNYARRVDGTLETTRWEDHTVPGVRSELRGYHSDGTTLASIARWLADEPDGRQETAYANGQVASRSDYVRGQLHGVHQTWRSDGTRQIDARYARNRRHGLWRAYDPSDRLISEIDFDYDRKRSENAWGFSTAGVLVFESSLLVEADGDRTYAETNRFESGQLLGVNRTFNGLPHGEHRRYQFESGVLQFLENYAAGELDGAWVSYHTNGQQHQVGFYLGGLKHGQWSEYDAQGNRLSQQNWADGDLNGAFQGWLSGGQLSGEGVYRDGVAVRQTTYNYFTDQGVITSVVESKTVMDFTTAPVSEKVWTYHENSQLASYTERSGGARHGRYETYTITGRATEVGTWFGGLPDGRIRRWDTNGIPVVEINYRLGRKHGTSVTYWSDSQVISEVANYVEDQLSGRVERYHDNGELRERAFYQAGELHRTRSTYDENGVLLLRENYSAGILDGLRESFVNGVLRLKERYVDGLLHGRRELFDSNGRRTVEQPYVEGILQGIVTHYSADVRTDTFQYVDGLKDGVQRVYSFGGRLIGEHLWQDGIQHGASATWDEEGRQRSSGQYTWGSQSGTWTFWAYDSEGNVETSSDSFGAGGNQPALFSVVRFTFLDSAGGVLGGRNVGESLNTAKNGTLTRQYWLSNSLSSNFVFEVPGYRMKSVSVSLSPGAFLEREVVMSRKGEPRLSGVIPIAGDHFMHGIPVSIPFQLNIDWGEMTPALQPIEVWINGVRHPNLFYLGDNNVVEVPAGSPLFKPSGSRRDNRIEFVGLTAEGFRTDPSGANIVMYPEPGWMSKLGGVFAPTIGDQRFEYKLTAKFPKPKLKVSAQIPQPSDFKVEVESQFGLEVKVDTTGQGGVKSFGKSKFALKGQRQGVEAESKIAGGARFRFDYSENGGPVWDEALEVAMTGKLKLVSERPILAYIPAVAAAESLPVIGRAMRAFNNQAKVVAELGGVLDSKVPVYIDANNDIAWDAAATKVGLEAGLGIKLEPFSNMKAELKGTGKGSVDLVFPPAPEYYRSGEWELGAELALEVFNVERKFSAIHRWRWPSSPAPAGLTLPASSSEWKPMDASFLRLPGYDQLVGGGRQPAGLGPTSSLLVQNIFPRSAPVVDTRNGRTMILYAALDPSDPVAQGNDIAFVYDDGSSMMTGKINDDTAGEFAPTVRMLPDGRVLAAWERVNDSALTGTNLTEFAGALEIVWSIFDPTNGMWQAPRSLTTNTWFDHSPRWIGGSNLMWQANSGNELIGTTNSPTQLRFARWEGTTLHPLTSSQPAFTNAFHFVGNVAGEEVRVAYVQDLDGDLATSTDQEIFLLAGPGSALVSNTWKEPFQLTINSVRDTRPFFIRGAAVSDPNNLFWKHDGALAMLTAEANGAFEVVASAESVSDGVPAGSVVLGGSERLLFWPQINNTNVSLVGRLLTGGPGGETVNLIAEAGEVRDVSVVSLGGGQMGLLYNQRDPISGQVDLHWRQGSVNADIAVTGVRLISGTVAGGNTIQVGVDLANAGLRSTGLFVLNFYAGDPAQGGNLIASRTTDLSGGATFTETISYDLLPGAIPMEIHVVADLANQISESDETNNQGQMDLLLPNWVLARGTIGFAASNRTHRISVTVTNDSPVALPATTAQLAINRTPAATADIAPLAVGQSTNLIFEAFLFDLLTNGPIELSIAVDPTNAVAESAEVDNRVRLRMSEISDGFVDTDGDQVDDNWELRYFGNLLRLAGGDHDNDGVSNLREFLSGTDPTDPADRFLLQLDRSSGRARIRWNGKPGRRYRVEVADAIGSNSIWRSGGDDHQPSGYTTTVEEFIDPDNATPVLRFYRVRIVP